jgi:hypothetical protein
MVEYSIQDGILTLKSEGSRTLDDVRAALSRALDDPALPAGVSVLVDVCESDYVPTPKEIVAFADFLKTVHDLLPRPCAVLACDVLRFGLGRQLSAWAAARGVRVGVFRLEECEAARKWLKEGAPDGFAEA